MVKFRKLSLEEISTMLSLATSGVSNKEIAETTGISLRSVQRYTRKLFDAWESKKNDPIARSTRKIRNVNNNRLRIMKHQNCGTPKMYLVLNPAVRDLTQRLIEEHLSRRSAPQTQTAITRQLEITDDQPKSADTTFRGGRKQPQEAFSERISTDESSDGELLDKEVELKVEIKEEDITDLPSEFTDMQYLEFPRDPLAIEVKSESLPSSSPVVSGIDVRPSTSTAGDVDDFHNFGMYVASQLRTMSLQDAIQTQLDIQAIIDERRSQSSI